MNLRQAGIYLFSGVVLENVVGLLAQILIARLLLPQDFGRFAIVMAATSLVIALISLRLNVLILRAKTITQAEISLFVSALFWEVIVATLITIIWLWFSTGIAWEELIIMAGVMLNHWFRVNQTFYERLMPYRQLTIIESGSALLGHIVGVVLAYAGFGVISLCIRELATATIRIIGLKMVGGLVWEPPHIVSLKQWKRLWQEAKGVWLDSLLEGGFQRLTVLMAGTLVGHHGAGIFFMAQRLAVIPHQLMNPVMARIAANWFARLEERPEQIKARNKLTLISVVVLSLAAGVSFFLSPFLVPLLFGNNWLEAIPALQAMSGMIVFMTLFEIYKVDSLTSSQAFRLIPARLIQYIGFMGVIFLLPDTMGLSLGLSLAWGAGFLVLAFLLHKREKQKCAALPE